MDPALLTGAAAARQGAGASGESPDPAPEGAAREPGWSVSVSEQRFERERVSFSAEAEIRTADGRRIAVDTELRMDRVLYESRTLRASSGGLKDPLVVNYAGSAASLTERNFQFDLDADGTQERMAFPGAGSGFLARDRNGNGTIDDGSELFGPATGSGFGELAALDSDGDGWVDEGDPAFRDLRIWAREGDGPPRLMGLGKAGVGALSVQGVGTEFSLRAGGAESGRLAETGLFLRESGEAGTVQEVDLRV
jgi:hypothetical protein